MATSAIKSPFAVAEPEINEVMDRTSGALIPAYAAIGSSYSKIINLRMELITAINRGDPIYVCSQCGVPVYLVSRAEARRFFFRHVLEDGRCTAETRNHLCEAEINARRYNGVKESKDHLRMKEIIADSLRCDPRFSDIYVESVWKGRDRGKWRKPDVSATYDGVRIAIEVQLSTTFLHVIAERREFYLQEGGLLLWVFKNFNENDARLTQEDIFYNNNMNIFLANEETLDISKRSGAFTLECRWATSTSDAKEITPRMERQMVSFPELTVDRKRQRVFFFDFDKQSKEMQNSALRVEFENFWLSQRTYDSYDQERWMNIRASFGRLGIILPRYPNDGNGPIYLLNALYSAKHGKPVGWRYKKLVEVAHCILDRHKNVLSPFRRALSAYNRAAQIRTEDSSGKWKERVKHYTPLVESGSVEYASDHRFDKLISFLFPEISGMTD